MGYSIIKADVHTDKTAVLELMNRNLGAHTQEWYDWKYLGCPAGPAQCWLVRQDGSNDYIGTAALFPRQYRTGGQEIKAGILGDFAIDKKHRFLGLAMQLQKHIMSVAAAEGFDFTCGIPNQKSEQVVLKIGYTHIGNFSRYTKLLSSEHKLRDIIKYRPVLKAAAFITDVWLRVSSGELFSRIPGHYTINIYDNFDTYIEEIIENIAQSSQITSIKRTKFLKWRYSTLLKSSIRIIVAYSGNRKPFACAVVNCQDKSWYIDEIILAQRKKDVSVLITGIIKHARIEKIKSIHISYLGDQEIKSEFIKAGFVLRDQGNKFVLYPLNPKISSLLLNQNNWLFLSGDNDA